MKKIYFICPTSAVAGGVESIYQAVDMANKLGYNAYITYTTYSDTPTPDCYRKYKKQICFVNQIEFLPKNMVILPEIWANAASNFKNINCGIWWLSVDNAHNQFTDWSHNKIYHFYQSEYAKDYLIKNNAKKIFPLHDYINSIYNCDVDLTKKENIIVYNPAKGIELTRKLIDFCPEFQFKPIVNMSVLEVIEVLKKSKVYIDFGNHPGRDRIPREAALLKNCIITGKRGSANFFEDIPIDSKFDENIEQIKESISDCLTNFHMKINEYSNYTDIINNQRETLKLEIKQLFRL